MAIAWLTVAVAFTGIIAIPALVLVIRLAIRWKGVEDTQTELIKDVKELVGDVKELATSMDRRTRWLEENVWKRNRRRSPRPPTLPTCYQAATVPLPDLTSRLVGCAYSTNRTEARRPPEMNKTEIRQNQISALRKMADWLEAHPQVDITYGIQVDFYCSMADAQAIRASAVGGWHKEISEYSNYTGYVRTFTHPDIPAYKAVSYGLQVAKRETCERVQIGTRHVEAQEAYDEPVYEWRCEPGEPTDGLSDTES